jgi:hypothetical protein
MKNSNSIKIKLLEFAVLVAMLPSFASHLSEITA